MNSSPQMLMRRFQNCLSMLVPPYAPPLATHRSITSPDSITSCRPVARIFVWGVTKKSGPFCTFLSVGKEGGVRGHAHGTLF